MVSIWIDTLKSKTGSPWVCERKALTDDIKTDVLIIGGGLAGLLCAYTLHQAGVDYVLVEADRVADGITKNTTAKITSQHGLIYQNLMKRFGKEAAAKYYEANERAIERYADLCREIDCDFERKASYVYSLDDREKLEREISALKSLGAEAELVNRTELPFPVAGAVRFDNQAQFHPLKFMNAIAPKCNIYEHTRVLQLLPQMAVTEQGVIEAKQMIVATHFPFVNKHGSYFLKMYQHRSYVIAYENVEKMEGMYVDESRTGLSFRSYQDYLLIGGGSHRTGKEGGNWEEISEFARKHYPNAKEKYRFATQDCMTLDQVPYIGRYYLNSKGLFVATGFNKWGMTSSMVAANLLCDMIMGKENPYEKLFWPSRSMLRPQLFLNGFEATKNLLWPTVKRCPHLGCALKWNKVEHSWDCPCHGSRFTEEGELIDNPATGNCRWK
ncbi:MAG: FAD-dependent oxidoreductase [Lachnospiraceae bacterium]